MQNKRFIVIEADYTNAKGDEERFYRELVYCFDDRHWMVRVWPQAGFSTAIRRFWLVGNLFYTWKLIWSGKSTVIVDYRMLPYLMIANSLLGRIGRHRWVVVVRNSYYAFENAHFGEMIRNRFRTLYLKKAKLILVDSLLTQIRLMEQGVEVQKIRILSAARKAALKCFEEEAPPVSQAEPVMETLPTWSNPSLRNY